VAGSSCRTRGAGGSARVGVDCAGCTDGTASSEGGLTAGREETACAAAGQGGPTLL
jgi:hypothetical protein